MLKILQEGDKNVTKIIGEQKLQENASYRLSDFVLMGQNNGTLYLKNNLSKCLIALDHEEAKAFPTSDGIVMDGQMLTAFGLQELVKRHFMVPVETKEYQKYSLVKTILENVNRNNHGIQKFTILPTTGCNARCVYCYEKGFTVKTMTDETADEVVDFICRTNKNSKVKLNWFGGEPLIAKHVIRRICTRLSERGMDFTSKIVTNAMLMTKETAREAKAIWHLEKAQVSVDGVRADYESRKQYYQPEIYNYDTLFCVIHALLDEGIEVTLRCNYDHENLPRIKDFVNDIQQEFHDSEKLFLYFGMLFQEQKKPDCVQLYRDRYELQKYIDQAGFRFGISVPNKPLLKVNYCMADSLEDSVLISPDGKLYRCESYMENNALGDVKDKSLKMSRVRGATDIHEDCKRCPFLPECTPFRRNGCPDWFPFCKEFKRIETNYYFEQLIKKWYDV